MILMIDNFDSFTFNLVQVLQTQGVEPVVVRNNVPELLDLALAPELEAVIISPGPSRPENAGLCLQFLEKLPPEVPVLGVCLGHQTLGLFGGGQVLVSGNIMHGKSSIITHNGQGIFAGLPQKIEVARYHSLLVHEQPEANFEVTSRTDEGEIMGLKYKDRPWYGVQFHPESILSPEGPILVNNFLKIKRKGKNMPTIQQTLDNLAMGKDLDQDMSKQIFTALFEGKLSPVQSGALLLGLRLKGETPEELSSAVDVALSYSRQVRGLSGKRIDTCGTGGDSKKSFNCSTAVSFFLADMGYKVVKHGNRAVSSQCGSADVIEAFGKKLLDSPEAVAQSLENENFAFLFAPHFHPAFKHVAPLRKDLGIRTLFNLMGPLLNPARPTHQVLGVADFRFAPIMAKVLAANNVRAAVVHGAGGYDELTPIGISNVLYIQGDKITEDQINPQDFGIETCTEQELTCETKEQSLKMQRLILNGKAPQAVQDMVALNLGMALHLLEDNLDLAQAVAQAKKVVAAGLKQELNYVA